MRRVAAALLATAAGLIALLSFKSHTPATTNALPAGQGGPTAAATNQSPAAGPGASNPPAPATTRAGTAGTGAKDGTYTGSTEDTEYGPVQVSITVSGGRLTHVTVLQVPSTGGYEEQIVTDALPILNSEAISAQSANIDSVSGATFTSRGYAQSLQAALDRAGLKQ
jgi:uncharacterized protein with FMN-binding domain